jgi:hypothetical protein
MFELKTSQHFSYFDLAKEPFLPPLERSRAQSPGDTLLRSLAPRA